jgi:hypothetical protein
MEYPWHYWLWASLIYGFGATGFFAVTLLPLRSYLLLRGNKNLLSAGGAGVVVYVLLVLVVVAAVILAAQSLVGVSKCLLGFHCSANRSGGWFFLAGVGFWYLAFELLSALILAVARRSTRVAT